MIAGGIGGILVLVGIYVYLGPLWLAIALGIPIIVWILEGNNYPTPLGLIAFVAMLVSAFMYAGPFGLAVGLAVPIAVWLLKEMFGSKSNVKH
ncbi:MAG: hypothetical protein IKO41_21620 [Lachnospiraceae bacterium]|nr:hypothetical protein [Lachnospiraceae bacterium]